jgi:hypothetical protein
VAQVWEFAGQERDEISIQMDALDGDLDPFLLLLSMSSRELDQFMSQGIEQPEGLVEIAERLGVLVHYNDDREDSADSLIFSDPLPADDVYYIVATSCCTAGSAGDYRLALELEFREEPLTETDPETERERDLEQPPDDDRNFIPETTRIIDEGIASRHLIDITGDGETLTFDEDVVDSLGRPFEENDIVALDPVDDAPFGLLRRVVEIEHDQGQVVLTTVQAALDEAIYNGQVQVEVVLTEDGGYIAQAAMGKTSAKPAARPAGAEFTLNFFEEEIIPGVTASGQVDLDPSFEFELVIRRFKLERLRLVNTTVQRAEISLEAEIGFSESAEIELSPLGSFAPIGIPIRGTSFNIWLTPQLTVYLGVAGSATAAVTSAVHHDITYDSGLEYDDGDLRFIADSTGSELWVEEPETSASVDARAYIKPEFALVVFGGSGPYINAQGYARFEADMCQSPWWEVYAGVSGNVGARVKVFSLKLIDETWQIFVEEWTLDEAEDSAPFACPGEDESEPTSAPQDSSPEDDGGGGVCSSVVGFVGILGLVVTVSRRKRR